MPTLAWQAIRSTNAGILVENTKFHKSFQNNLNTSPKTPMLWDIPWEHSSITNLTQVSSSQVSLPIGFFLVIMPIQVRSPTSAKLQIQVTAELAATQLDEISYSGLTVATDEASSIGIWLFPNPAFGAILEFFGERSGTAGNLDVVSGELNIIRLSNNVFSF